ncbi:glycosyltransferase [Candidatus Microgenomates bacterium]|nr:MAG: glycosyltransferase [Candidatus Microgenomates bacterium]
MHPELTVVIPCFNEEQNIRLGALDKVAGYMQKQKYSWEVLIVDDGSRDASVSLITSFIKEHRKFKLLQVKHKGKAATVVSGMMVATGEHILFTDLDQATPLSELEKLLPWKKDFDIVIGSRKDRRVGAPLLRKSMGVGFMILRNLILGLGFIKDTQCGFKLFSKQAAQAIFPKLVLYKKMGHASGPKVTAGFDVEVLFVANRHGFNIKEVPVEWHYVETRRVNPIFDSLDGLWSIIQIRLLSLRGAYA